MKSISGWVGSQVAVNSSQVDAGFVAVTVKLVQKALPQRLWSRTKLCEHSCRHISIEAEPKRTLAAAQSLDARMKMVHSLFLMRELSVRSKILVDDEGTCCSLMRVSSGALFESSNPFV